MTTDASSRVRLSNNHNLLSDRQWVPVTGWPLAILGELAENSCEHALLTFACRSRARWRQSVFLALALGITDNPRAFLTKAGFGACPENDLALSFARGLTTLSPADILGACFETRPAALLGVLGKVGFQTLDAEIYRLLASWYASPGKAARYTSALQAMTEVDQPRIEALSALNPVLAQMALSPFVRTKEAALELNAALDVISDVCSSATEERLTVSARALQSRITISAWCKSWLRRADRFPPPPFAGDDECFPLTTAQQVLQAGQRFKNCLGARYLAPAISGTIAIVEFGPGVALALLLRLRDEHWFLLGVHAPRNMPAPADLVARVQQKVLSFSPGIFARTSLNQARSLLLQKYLLDDSLADLDLAPFEF